MKYFIITFFFISILSGYNSQFIKRLERIAQSTNVTWFKDMVILMTKQLQGRQLKDMPLSSFAPFSDIISDAFNSINITKVTCVKMFTPPNSNVINEIEIEVLDENNESRAIQFSTYNHTLAAITRKIANKVKKV